MTTYASITVGGTSYTDAESIQVTQNLSTGTASFEATFDNRRGDKKSVFSLGQDVNIKHDTVNPAVTVVFRGIVENIQFVTQPNNDKVIVRGRDYSARLMDTYVQKVYTNTEVSVIVKDIIDSFVNIRGYAQIAYTNVVTTTKTVSNIVFRERSCFEAIKQLAELVNYDFWIDTNRDLNFRPELSIDSTYTLDNTTVKDATFRYDDNELFNIIKVYGGGILTAARENFTANGAGSAFTLANKPHNTTVLEAGSVVRRGHIFEFALSEQPSGAQYLIDFDQKNIIFISGTNNGDNIPASGKGIQVDYYRQLPIIKQAQDEVSIGSYAPHMKIIRNEEITDPLFATDLAKNELKRYSRPIAIGDIQVDSNKIPSLQIGHLITVNLSNQNITTTKFKALEVNYDLRKQTLRDHNAIRCTVAESRVQGRDTADILRQMELDIRKLKGDSITDTDLLSILEFHQEQVEMRDINWYARTRPITTFGFVLDDPSHGILDTSVLNDNTYGAYAVQASGGYLLQRTITAFGRDHVRNRIGSDVSLLTHIGIGSGSGVFDGATSGLYREFFRNSFSSGYPDTGTTDVIKFLADFNTIQTSGISIREASVFVGATGSTATQKAHFPAINTTGSNDFQYEVQLQVI